MMQPVHRVHGDEADAVAGQVEYDPAKMSWNLGIVAAALVFAPITFSVGAFVLFLTTTYVSLLVGHSAGMHRMMIHRTYDCHAIVEKSLVYVGVLVGMSGPSGMIKIHDVRDWAQRQRQCHDFFSHTRSYWRDVWWQLTSRFVFDRPPDVVIESKYADNGFYQFLDRTWRYHQLVVAAIFYVWGGWPFLVWGVFVRVAVSIVGHWSITYFCHNPGQGSWRVADAAVQASNIPGLGILTYGECWHNNHHAFPESARIGLDKGQSDPAYRLIQFLGKAGLASNIGIPRPEDQRGDLRRTCDGHSDFPNSFIG